MLHTQNPRLGSSLESAIEAMNAAGGYNLSVADAKAKLGALGYYDKGNGAWSDIKSWTSINSTSEVTKTYSQTAEGVYLYQVVITDVAGNKTTKNSSVVYLDHTKPVINGTNSTVTDWTNTAPVISVTATDYLSGTTYNGSGVIGVVIANEEGVVKASGTNSATYTLKASDEGIHMWTIIATDGVEWQTMTTVTTKYDKTAPGMDGTEVVYVKPDGTTVSGYCQDNIINQHIDDAKSRSLNNPNVTSGLKSVIVYKYYKTGSVVLYGDTVKKTFTTSDTNSYKSAEYAYLVPYKY